MADDNQTQVPVTEPNPQVGTSPADNQTAQANQNAWLGPRLEEERRKAAAQARKETEEEYQRKYGAALKWSNYAQQAGQDPEAMIAAYERELQQTQAQQVGMTPEAYMELQQLRQAQQATDQRLADQAKRERERELNGLLVQAENAVANSEPLGDKYRDTIRQHLGSFARFFRDGDLPTLDELKGEARKAYRDASYEEKTQTAQATAQQAAQANQAYRETRQTVENQTAVPSQLPTVDLQALATSKKPEDKVEFERIVQIATRGTPEERAKYRALLGF